MNTITVWLLVFNGMGYTDAGNSMMAVDELPTYIECQKLGTEISNGHRIVDDGWNRLVPKFTCHKHRKAVAK
jgi:hypothetical protein